jgi:hypothetical protein
MKFDVAHETFRMTAVEWLSELDDEALLDVKSIFASSPGYYPSLIHELWLEVVAARGLTAPTLDTVGWWSYSDFPVGHPEECDWRFTDVTTMELLRDVTSGLTPGDRVAHIGAPSTFICGTREFSQFEHFLIERNASVTSALDDGSGHVFNIDLSTSDTPMLGATGIVADPPWYPEETVAFLAASSRLGRTRGRVWLCQPTPATRPGVLDERAKILGQLDGLGLRYLRVLDRKARYDTPHFEAMSLRLTATPVGPSTPWRLGDVLVLEKIGPVRTVPRPLPREAWFEVQFGPVRIKIRQSGALAELAPLVPGDVLDTVSRRDPVRSHIGVWTSGNRIFGTNDPVRVGKLISLCNSDLKCLQFTYAHTMRHAEKLGMSSSTAQMLFDVLLVELQEHQASEGVVGGKSGHPRSTSWSRAHE